MTVVYPDGTPTLGNTKITAVLSVAVPTAPKVATELLAATSVDLSCFVYPAGWNPGATTNKGTKPPRLCSKATQEQFNRTQYTLPDLQYVHSPQLIDTDPSNKARKTLVEGLTLYIVERQGLDAQTTAWAVGQYTLTHKLVLGPQIWSGDRTDENGEFFVTQPVIYAGTGPIQGLTVT